MHAVIMYRDRVISSLEDIAANADAQRASNFPPEELRLNWEDCYAPLSGIFANPDYIAEFTPVELSSLARFNEFIWSLPPEPDAMWNRDNLDTPPWHHVRSLAEAEIKRLRIPFAAA